MKGSRWWITAGSIAGSGVATAAMRAPEGGCPDALFDDPLARLLVSLAGEVREVGGTISPTG
jgi:O-methyltransferase involved in polyketide biosynthesis